MPRKESVDEPATPAEGHSRQRRGLRAYQQNRMPDEPRPSVSPPPPPATAAGARAQRAAKSKAGRVWQQDMPKQRQPADRLEAHPAACSQAKGCPWEHQVLAYEAAQDLDYQAHLGQHTGEMFCSVGGESGKKSIGCHPKGLHSPHPHCSEQNSATHSPPVNITQSGQDHSAYYAGRLPFSLICQEKEESLPRGGGVGPKARLLAS
jgi:hypothetical protein